MNDFFLTMAIGAAFAAPIYLVGLWLEGRNARLQRELDKVRVRAAILAHIRKEK